MHENIDKIIQEALALCDDENPGRAEQVVQNALANHPNNVDLLTTYGIVQSKLDLEEEAEHTFRKALAIDSHDENAICALGRLLDSSLRADEAQELLRDFLKEHPQSHCAVDDLCRILLSEGLAEDALKIAEQHSLSYSNEVDAYTAARYVLARVEDELCFEYDGDEDNSSYFMQLFSVFVNQFELILRMEKAIGEQTLRDAGVYCDLQEDIIRLTGELEHLIHRVEEVSWAGKREIIKKVVGLLEIGVERRKTTTSME